MALLQTAAVAATFHGPHAAGPESCATAGWYSYLTFQWLNPLVEAGNARQVGLDDTPALAGSDDTMLNTERVLANLAYSERAGRRHPLLRAILSTYWPQLLVYVALMVANQFLILANPILLQQVLIFQEALNTGMHLQPSLVARGSRATLGMVVFSFFFIVWSVQVQFYKLRLSVRMKSALRGAVLYRCVHARPGRGHARAKQGGEGTASPTVYNVISWDVDPNVDIIWVVLDAWIFPVQITTVLVALFAQVRWAVVPGLVTIVVAKIIDLVLYILDGVYRHRMYGVKDERLARCTECFNHIRTVHMHSWVSTFQDNIMAARDEELRLRSSRLWFTKMIKALDYSLSPMVTLVTFGYYTLVARGSLTASLALPVIDLIVSLVNPFDQIPKWANDFLVWHSAYHRVNAYMDLSDGSNDTAIIPDGREGPHISAGLSPSAPTGSSDVPASAAFHGCTLSWGAAASEPNGDGRSASSVRRGDVEEGGGTSEPLRPPPDVLCPLLEREPAFQLRDLSLRVSGGELLVLVGREGQGKSSALKGLLGEMSVREGQVVSPAARQGAAGSPSEPLLPASMADVRQLLADHSKLPVDSCVVPYSSQDTVLFTGTIQENIVFGRRYDSAVYDKVIQACALDMDIAAMPAGEFTEVALGGVTVSGGQRARISLARAAYCAALAMQEQPGGAAPLVLLDDPVCSLDSCVAREVCESLFAVPSGLLAPCAVVVATADPWWLGTLRRGAAGAPGGSVRIAVLRDGYIVRQGPLAELQGLDLVELEGLPPGGVDVEGARQGGGGGTQQDRGSVAAIVAPQEPVQDPPMPPPAAAGAQWNPQDDVDSTPWTPTKQADRAPPKQRAERHTQTEMTEKERKAGAVVAEERREEGHVKWSTYRSYFWAVGPLKLSILSFLLVGISLFQNCCTVWITYWTSGQNDTNFATAWVSRIFGAAAPSEPGGLLTVYAIFTGLFTLCNFAGHGAEVVGGVCAAAAIFKDALRVTLRRPFMWWDQNPTGRVLNRFSQDVGVMDDYIVEMMGVIFGAAIFFLGHVLVLAVASPWSICLLPVLIGCMAYFGTFYRRTVREVQRNFLVSMSTVYQGMVEAIVCSMTIRAFALPGRVCCKIMDDLDGLQRSYFAKESLTRMWVELRLQVIGFLLNAFNQLRPLLQYHGVLGMQNAALVGFSIQYSKGVIDIVAQFILNMSDLEMQLVSIERLMEYSAEPPIAPPPPQVRAAAGEPSGLALDDVVVTYRGGLRPAFRAASLSFAARSVTAVMGRTGAGKTSLLLSVLQLVPYTGRIRVGGQDLAALDPEGVRRQLVGVVPQFPVLFAGDLRWNLDPENLVADVKIWEALRDVGLDAVCRSAGHGLRASLTGSAGAGGEGVGKLSLSQAQQQLLCAARALIRQPQVALLDEVTASFPPEMSSRTLATLTSRFRKNAVVLLVTHQERLLEHCDRVVTVVAGRVVNDRRLAAPVAM